MALFVMMLFAIVGEIVLSITSIPLFAITAVFTLSLTGPVFMLTASKPGVTVSPEGLLVQPLFWGETFVEWGDIREVKPYTLLPPEDGEVFRKLMVGRLKYAPATGIMLVIPSLPFMYRVHGFFSGEGFTPTIALTNRSHAEYDKLEKKVLIYAEDNGVPVEKPQRKPRPTKAKS